MSRVFLKLSDLGARLGNWNDSRTRTYHDRIADESWAWRKLDRLSSRLYVLGDRAGASPGSTQ